MTAKNTKEADHCRYGKHERHMERGDVMEDDGAQWSAQGSDNSSPSLDDKPVGQMGTQNLPGCGYRPAGALRQGRARQDGGV